MYTADRPIIANLVLISYTRSFIFIYDREFCFILNQELNRERALEELRQPGEDLENI